MTAEEKRKAIDAKLHSLTKEQSRELSKAINAGMGGKKKPTAKKDAKKK